MDLLRLREEIPALEGLTYLNTGWSGPPPRRAAQAMKDRIDLELRDGPTTAHVYEAGRQIQEAARAAAARLLHAAPDEVLITRNTTEGLNIVLSGLAWRAGDEIITCNLEHGSVLGPSRLIAQRYGAAVRVVELQPHDSHAAIVEKFAAAVTPRTRLIFVSHIQYSTGLRMPAEELGRLAHSSGAQLLLDGAQTAGHIVLDMAGSGFDFYSIPGQKWALGYEGVGALFIRRELIGQVHPAHTGGRGLLPSDNPYAAEPNTDSMDKFLGGSASVPLQAAFVAAAQFIEEVGIAEIEARNLALAARLKAALAQMPSVAVNSPADAAAASGLVAFAVAGREPAAVVQQLWERHRIVVRQVSYPPAVRASLHFFNTEAEVDALANAIASL